MLPRLNNYLLADNSQLWGFTAKIAPNITLRWEHQLFPGLGVVLLLLAGIAWRFKTVTAEWPGYILRPPSR